MRSRRRAAGSMLRVKTPGRATASVQCSDPPRTPHSAHIDRLPSPSRDSPHPRRSPGEVVRHLVHRHEADAWMADHVMVEPLQHHQYMRPARYVRMDRYRKDRVVVFAINPVELVAPHLLDVARIDEAVAVRGLFNKEHRRQVVEIPARGYLDQVSFPAAPQRHH